MKQAKQIFPLTSLRFFAAFLVVLHHTLPTIVPSIEHAGWPARLQTFSGTTVLLFFILSGFVLALVYLEPETPIAKRNFWAVRVARIYPLYLTAIALDVPNLFHARLLKYGLDAALLKTSITFAGSALFLQQWFPFLGGLDFPSWSLSVEALFYAIFPMLGPVLWRWPLRMQLATSVVTYLFFWGAAILGSLRDIPALVSQPITFLPYFISGIVLASLRQRIALRPDWLAQCRALAPAGVLLAAVALILGCLVRVPVIDAVLPGGIFLPAYSLLLLCFAIGSPAIERVFSHRWLILLGEASYALYLLHILIWGWFLHMHLPMNPFTYVLYLAAAIALSIVSFRYLEVPARRWLLRRWHERSHETKLASSLAQ